MYALLPYNITTQYGTSENAVIGAVVTSNVTTSENVGIGVVLTHHDIEWQQHIIQSHNHKTIQSQKWSYLHAVIHNQNQVKK